MPDSFSDDSPIPSAPPCSVADDFDQNYITDYYETRRQQEETDEAFARMLQAQENAALEADHGNDPVPHTIVTSTPDTPLYAAEKGLDSSSAIEMEDERLARALEQEMRDEELARAMQQREEGRMRRATSVSLANNGPPASTASTSRCSARRIVSGGFFLVILGTAAVLLVVFGSSIWNRLGGNGNDLPPFFRNGGGTGDESSSPGEFSQWKNNKNGLKLTVRNALSSDWDTYFVKAVSEWNAAPALQLSTQDAAEDPSCSSVRGILKVCNDFYGKKGWTGLNEIYFEGSYIAASVAKMNESYLSSSGTSTAEKQYVMCHEIGHGFGLPHRDEIPNNPDLGSCLDYTYRFENNVHPDSSVDFDNLKNLYGVIGNRRRTLQVEDVDGVNINDVIFRTRNWSHENGRMLYQSERHQVYENDLGGGLRVVTTLLLADKASKENVR